MKIYNRPDRREWQELLMRPGFDKDKLQRKVGKIIAKVKKKGDKALQKYTHRFDGPVITDFAVNKQEIDQAARHVSDELKAAIAVAHHNIRQFHESQLTVEPLLETMPGVQCWRSSIPIDRVGLYIPGGSAPLFSTVLMLAIPALVAGCPEVILCTPPDKDGQINAAVLYAASICGISKIFKVGGAQAIAAMAYGTETIPAVYKIFGPGNQYVNCAKLLVQQDVAIDMPAGPSEVCVLADESGDPSFIAADLLSQAEHGPDSQVLMVTTSARLAEQTGGEVLKQLRDLPRRKFAGLSLDASRIIVAKDLGEAVDIVNQYAPEHLIIAMDNAREVAGKITNAGSVFLGHFTPEAAGDYASGTNHTLPTNGWARSYSGVSVDSFLKKITFQEINPEGLHHIGNSVEIMARAEGLDGHANAVTLRLNRS